MTPLRSRAMPQRAIAIWSLLVFTVACCWVPLLDAKPARCFTSDDGSFACEFRATASDGSFTISAPGKPTYILNIIEPGVALGFVHVGTRNIPLPGRYLRSAPEPACWVNDATGAKLCAR